MKKLFLIIMVTFGLTACTALDDFSKFLEPKVLDTTTDEICNDLKKNALNKDKYVNKYIQFSGKAKVETPKSYLSKPYLLVSNIKKLKGNYNYESTFFHVNDYPNLKSIVNDQQINISGKIENVKYDSISKFCTFSIAYYKEIK